jgi:tol-pal system protein YbgF
MTTENPMARIVILVFAALLLGGCANTETVARQDMADRRIEELSAASQKLSLRMDELSREMVDLKERLSRAEKAGKPAETKPAAAAETPAPKPAEAPPAPFSVKGEEKSAPVETELPAPPRKAEAEAPKPEPKDAKNGTAKAPAPPAPPAAPAPPDEPTALYSTAFAGYRNGKFAKAILDFEEFLQKYPDHDYADDAQYWIGESYFSQGEYEQAVVEFARLLERFANKARAADACYMMGESYEKLGQPDKATAFYRRTVSEYPQSEGARRAKLKLKTP